MSKVVFVFQICQLVTSRAVYRSCRFLFSFYLWGICPYPWTFCISWQKSEIAANYGISSFFPFPSFSKSRFPPQKQCTLFKSLHSDDLFVTWHAQSPELTYDLLITYERTDDCELWCFCKYHHHSSVNACSVWSYSHTQFLWDPRVELNTEIQVTSSQDPSTLIFWGVYQYQGYLVPLGSSAKSKTVVGRNRKAQRKKTASLQVKN